jgi:hypothetical protein
LACQICGVRHLHRLQCRIASFLAEGPLALCSLRRLVLLWGLVLLWKLWGLVLLWRLEHGSLELLLLLLWSLLLLPYSLRLGHIPHKRIKRLPEVLVP